MLRTSLIHSLWVPLAGWLMLAGGSLLADSPVAAQTAAPLLTTAERTDYQATARHEEVLSFCEELGRRSPHVRLEYFGTTHAGRKLPVLVLGNPPPAGRTPDDARWVALVVANIHGGEVDGKEAVLALARDWTIPRPHPLLRHLIVLVVPNLNADGNDQFGRNNRPGQNGPALVGTRANAQGYDLNRDFTKLDSPEIRALVDLIRRWQPEILIDCHTTNGSRHRYVLTYDGPRYPDTDAPLSRWARAELFPAVERRFQERTGWAIAPYGNFSPDRRRWLTYPALPRYGVQYYSLRGGLSILSESYSYAPFRDRVRATAAFVTCCLEVIVEKREPLKDILKAPPRDEACVVLRTEAAALGRRTIRGYAEREEAGRRIPTDEPRDYEIEELSGVRPRETVRRPAVGYALPAGCDAIAATLRRHGIIVQELCEDIDVTAEVYRLKAVRVAAQAYQGRKMAEVEVESAVAVRRLLAGSWFVPADQPLGRLAAYLLEPRSEDGLAAWGLFNDHLQPGGEYPVLRIRHAPPLLVREPSPLPEHRGPLLPITDALLFNPDGTLSLGFQGSPTEIGGWLDAEHFLQVKDGKLWKVEARTGQAELFADPQAVRKSLQAVPELDAATIDRLSQATSYRFNPDYSAFLFNVGQDIGIGYFDGRPGRRLTRRDGRKEFASFSPDGRRIAYVCNGNLYCVDVASGEDRQLTHDGGGDLLNGRADWVYEEEIFHRHGKAYWWSPDSRRLLFLQFDDRPVRRFTITGFGGTYGEVERYPYPKAGEANPVVRIGVVPAAGGKPAFLDLGDYPPADTLVVRVGWLPDSKRLYAYVQNRTQTWLDILIWDDPGGKPRRLFRETTAAWVEDLGEPRFLPDGSFLILSERSGWKHLYHYAADGTCLKRLTHGSWEVQELLRVDAADRKIYFTAAMTSPTGSDFCVVDLDGRVTLLSEKGQSHRVRLAPSGPLYIDRCSDPFTPTQVRLGEVGRGIIRQIDTNPVRERERFRFGRYERVQIPLKDGFVLEGAITYPPDFQASKKYPMWLFTYGGPHAPTIRDEYSAGRVLDQTLARSGIVVFRVDPRSASGKGAQSAWTCYKQLGVQELRDLEEAVDWLVAKGWADPARIGISGHSYGGFLAAYALTHSRKFAAGIASGPVTDWRLYDTIYTERYMLTPPENPEGYARTSCVAAAKNLHGRLLIIHGMLDDNVHLQNSVQLIDALQRVNKPFEMMFYPNARHGIRGPHYMQVQLEFIRRTMRVSP